MGSKLGIRRETFAAPEDHSWLGSQHGTEMAQSITLLSDAFIDRFPTGVVPSGVTLARFASGDGEFLYTLYAGKVATITVTATGGNVDITVDGVTHEAVAVTTGTSAATLKAALADFPGIDADKITVVKDGTVHTVTGEFPDIAIEDANSTGGTVVVDNAAGDADLEDACAGHLYTTTDVGTEDGVLVTAALYAHGRVIERRLPTGHGLTEAAKADLPTIRYTEG